MPAGVADARLAVVLLEEIGVAHHIVVLGEECDRKVLFFLGEAVEFMLLEFFVFSADILRYHESPGAIRPGTQPLHFSYHGAKIISTIERGVHESLPPAIKKQALSAEVLGPSPCAIAKISMNYRYQILLRASGIQFLQRMCETLLFGYTVPANVYIECDVDPVSLL